MLGWYFHQNAEGEIIVDDGLANIQNGVYAKQFIQEGQIGYPMMTAHRRNNAAHQIEQVGERLRGMMPWIKKIVDKSKN